MLDAFEKIAALYAYDPMGQAWVQIKSFKIINGRRDAHPRDSTMDGNPYVNFWAYDSSNQTWKKVSLMPYLQQTNTQINSDSLAIATQESVLPHPNHPLHDGATDALLEELLGVHTFVDPVRPRIWANLSFDCSIGAGAIFYSNHLEQMYVLQRVKQDYFLETKTGAVYKPNWFHYTLHQVTDFDPWNHIEQGSSDHAVFQGKGLGLPITLGMQYVFWDQLLVGVGKEMVFHITHKLFHNDQAIKDKAYVIHKKWSTQGRWFAKCGWYACGHAKHRFFGDIRLLYVQHLGRMFSRLITFGPYLHQALAYNFGLGYEQQLTDYLSCIARLSIEWQKFKQFKTSYGYNIQYQQPAVYLQVGLLMRAAKYHPSSHLKCKEYQSKNNKLNDLNHLDGLQDLLGLDE